MSVAILSHFLNKWDYAQSILREAQKLATDRLVKLYEIDATNLGGTIFRFCNSVDTKMAVVSLTPVGHTATLETMTPHTLESGDLVRVLGAEQAGYSGDFAVTVIDSTHFSYTMDVAPSEPATGQFLIAMRLNNVVRFDGNSYIPIEVEVSGFEWNGQGSQATPKFLVSNKHKILVASVLALNNLRGAKFTRIRTFRKHLDDGEDPNPAMFFPKEVLRINRKAAQNKIFMEFELANPLDQEGAKIPGAQCLKNTCTHRYRIYDADSGSFDYSKATCPYAGSTYFTRNNQATFNPALDECSRQLKGCTDRFGTAPLPTRAIPGIGGR